MFSKNSQWLVFISLWPDLKKSLEKKGYLVSGCVPDFCINGKYSDWFEGWDVIRNTSKAGLLIWNLFKINSFIKKSKYVLVYSPGPIFPVFSSIPQFVTIHDLAYIYFKKEANLVSRFLMSWFYKKAFKKANTLITISNQVFKECVGLGVDPSRLVVAPNALVPLASKVTQPSEFVTDRYFLYIGAYRFRKNIEFMLRAYVDYLEKGGDCDFVLIGSVAEKESYLKKLIPEQWHKKFVFKGFVSEEEKRFYLGNAKAVLLVSIYEGFGLPVLEAQKAGTPIIFNDIEVLREVSGGVGFFVKDHKDLVGAYFSVESLDIDSLEVYKKQALENVSKFSWARSAEIIVDSFEKVSRY